MTYFTFMIYYSNGVMKPSAESDSPNPVMAQDKKDEW